MLSPSDTNQADVIGVVNYSTSRYLHDLLNNDNHYFEQILCHIYPTKLQLNKASFLKFSIRNGILSSKINDKRDAYNFKIVNVKFLDGESICLSSFGVYLLQLILFAKV